MSTMNLPDSTHHLDPDPDDPDYLDPDHPTDPSDIDINVNNYSYCFDDATNAAIRDFRTSAASHNFSNSDAAAKNFPIAIAAAKRAIELIRISMNASLCTPAC